LERLSLANRTDDRYSLLPLTRTYTLSLATEWRAYRETQVQYYIEFCRANVGGTTECWENYDAVDLERENLLDVLEWCFHEQQNQSLIDLQDMLWAYWELRDHFTDQEKWCTRAIDACECSGDSPLLRENKRKQGDFHLALCWVRINQDRFDEARREAQRALDIHRPIDYLPGIAVAERHLGLIEKKMGDIDQDENRSYSAAQRYAQAQEHYERALSIWERVRDDREISSILANLGHLYISREQFFRARGYLERALAMREEINDRPRMSTNCRALGEIDEYEENLDRARDHYKEAFTIAEEIGDKKSAGRAALRLAKLLYVQRRRQGSLEWAREADALFGSLNSTAAVERDILAVQDLINSLCTPKGSVFDRIRRSFS
jgi:tetratricopeptide (TPR) repeat protein